MTKDELGKKGELIMKDNIKINFQKVAHRGAWLAQSVKWATLDLRVVEFEPHIGCRDYLKNKIF